MSVADKLSYLKTRISILVPGMDTSAASPLRLIMDAFAELSAQADMAEEESFQWDINRYSGRDLDNFASVFGFERIPARYATGLITVRFGGHVSNDYLVPAGTKVTGNRNGRTLTYRVATDTAVPRFSSVAIIPIIADTPGTNLNARAGEVRKLDYQMDSVLHVVNEKPLTGGKESESDEEFRGRFRSNLFRNNLGSEDYYLSVAFRHGRVSAAQLLKPMEWTEEHLQIVSGEAQSQQDSLKFSYPNTFSVKNVNKDAWLEEGRDFDIALDNDTPHPPFFTFLRGGNWENGDDILVRYAYSSNRSRNDPAVSITNKLDLYIRGSNPSPVMEYAFWPQDNEYGRGLNETTHPGGKIGQRYHVFVRQPVLSLRPEMQINGKTYLEGRDYKLLKDKGPHADSSRARDAILFISSLPERRPDSRGRPGEPAFYVPYYHESVVTDIQEILDDPAMRVATDDVLCHAASNLVLDVSLTIEWERGKREEVALRDSIQNHLSTVGMGSTVRIGPLIRAIQNSPGVTAAFLSFIKTKEKIRGRTEHNYDIPLTDGTVPVLGELNVTNTASNLYV